MSEVSSSFGGVPRPLDEWWARRQWATGLAVPYPVGRFREAWAPYVPLVAQFRPDRNGELLLSQIPPAAEVYLVWVCTIGHEFVATPSEQRARPGARGARGDWCPVCATPSLGPAPPSRFPRPPGPRRIVASAPRVPVHGDAVPARPGMAFRSAAASRATSATQERLAMLLGERLTVDLTFTAVTVAQPFHGKREVWPDIVISELAIAVEYDTVGRAGDEHVGRRERSDRRKDALLRQSGWEVVRLRQKPLRPLGRHDLVVAGISAATVDRLIDRLAEVRGALIVAAYRDTEAARRTSP